MSDKTVLCTERVGSGEIVHRQGFFTLSVPCPHCSGLGRKVKPSPEQDLKDKLLR